MSKIIADMNRRTNIDGIVKLETDGDIEQVAFFTASVNVDGNSTSSRSIQNAELFSLHREEINKVFSEFDSYVYEIAEESRKKWEDAKKQEEEPNAESTQ